jgi:hypothetical protein
MGRKESLSVTLNSHGLIQLKLENIAEGDVFSVVEGITELQLPSSILQPLDHRMELLLSTGGDLVIRRAQKEADRISLRGFAAVISYLRWVNARQDYSVLPRNWPVPNSNTDPTAAVLTQATSWASPMPQPQPQPVPQPIMAQPASGEVAEVRGELRVLRELLLDRQSGAAPMPAVAPSAEEHVRELQNALEILRTEVARLQDPNAAAMASPAPVPVPAPAVPAVAAPAPMPSGSDAHQMAKRLEYLMTEIGLAPEVALMLVQPEGMPAQAEAALQPPDVVEDILSELRSQIPAPEPTQMAPAMPAPNSTEYMLLSEYFRSVFQAN